MCDEWLPIESVPRDGSKFLVTDWNRFSDARWPEKHILGRWEPIEGGDEFNYGGGPILFDPTHWTNLPQPPDICPLIGCNCKRSTEQVGDHLCLECDEGE